MSGWFDTRNCVSVGVILMAASGLAACGGGGGSSSSGGGGGGGGSNVVSISGHVYGCPAGTQLISPPSGSPIVAGAVVSTSLDATTATTDAAGYFSLRTTAPASLGNSPYTITTTAPGYAATSQTFLWGASPTNQGFCVDLSPPQVSALAISAGNGQSATVGTTLPVLLKVVATMPGGQAASGAAVAWAVASGGGTLSQMLTATGSDGTASVQWTLGNVAGTNAVTAAVAGVPPVTFTATGNPGLATQVVLTNPKNPLITGDAIQIAATGVDGFGNPTALPSPISWTATPATVVTTSPAGVVSAVGAGAGFVTAVAGGHSATLPVVVNGNITFAVGAEEVVFRYATDACAPGDNPDVPARAVRLADGSLELLTGDVPKHFAMFGPDFNSLKRSCTAPTLSSDFSPTADTFDNGEWIWAVYRQGSVIHALIHNEFHDPVALNCSPGNPYPGNPCLYVSITYASSSDGGHTFTHTMAPTHVVAPPAIKWNPGPPTPAGYGSFNPSNIVLNPDGFYYSVFMSIDQTGNQGMCVMRTQVLADPASWRAWDGTGFNLQMTDPYTSSPNWCTQAVSGGLGSSLTFNTYLGAYVLIGDFASPLGCGTAFVTSTDLIHWSQLTWLRAAYHPTSFPGAPLCLYPPGQPSYAYAAMIDHADATPNFEMPGQTVYLYYTRFNNGLSPDRDVVRLPVTITKH